MSGSAPHRVATSIAAETSQLASLRDFIRTHVAGSGFNDYEVNGIVLAIDEACANLILHGYGNDRSKAIDITLDVSPSGIRIDILDSATSFDPAVAPRPDIGRYVADKRRGGWGIALISRVMDDIRYTPISGTEPKNRLTLIKRRHVVP